MLIVFKLLRASNGKYFGNKSLMRISKKCLIHCLAHSRSFTSVSTFLLLPLFERRLPFLLLPHVSPSSLAHAKALYLHHFPAVTSLQQLPIFAS